MSSYGGDGKSSRAIWPNKLEYHLSLFSYLLGLLSFWRFPYLVYHHEGAPFLYAFLILYTLLSIPVIFLELAWGQYGSLGPLQAFKVVPAMQGIGVCMLFLSCMLLLYFGAVSYYFLLYLTSSFSYVAPWSTCDNQWNTVNCYNQTVRPCFTDLSAEELCNATYVTGISPSIEFWTENLMRNSSVCAYNSRISEVLFGSNVNALTSPIVVLACFVAGRLLIALLALANHIRFTGKVAYLLSTLPFAVMALLLVRCVTLKGSSWGLELLFKPNPASFLSAKVGVVRVASKQNVLHRFDADGVSFLLTVAIIFTCS